MIPGCTDGSPCDGCGVVEAACNDDGVEGGVRGVEMLPS